MTKLYTNLVTLHLYLVHLYTHVQAHVSTLAKKKKNKLLEQYDEVGELKLVT